MATKLDTDLRFKIGARPTRGGYRGTATIGDDVVAMKTVPVFRSEDDAKKAMRTWLKERGAHADRHIAYRERKLIPRKFFALPERAPGRGALPLADPKKGWRYDAAHVRNAAARLEQMRRRGSVNAEEYHRAAQAIMRGARATGVQLRALSLRTTTRMAAYSR